MRSHNGQSEFPASKTDFSEIRRNTDDFSCWDDLCLSFVFLFKKRKTFLKRMDVGVSFNPCVTKELLPIPDSLPRSYTEFKIYHLMLISKRF